MAGKKKIIRRDLFYTSALMVFIFPPTSRPTEEQPTMYLMALLCFGMYAVLLYAPRPVPGQSK